MVYFLHFTVCLISPCSLSWLHMSTANFCTFHLMLLGNREGKYENSQEVFNSVRTVYQGLQLTYVFSLILSLLSFPSDLRYSKQGLCLKSVPKGRHLAQQRVLAAPVSQVRAQDRPFAGISLLLAGCTVAKQYFLLVNFCHRQHAGCLVSRRWFIGFWKICSIVTWLFALLVECAHIWVFESWQEKPGSIHPFHKGFVTK